MPAKLIELVTPPVTARYTSLATVKTEIGISGSGDDTFLTTLIDEASERVSSICNRPFYRAQFRETGKGSGTLRQTVSRLPVVSIDAVSYDGDALDATDFSIEDAEAGFLYYSAGWTHTSDPTDWVVTYTAGFFCPADDQSGTTLSAVASDDSFNDSDSGFPTTLRSGDVLVADTDWDAANRGRHVVTGTPTAAKVATTSALSDEAAGGTKTILLRNLPGPIERATIELVKSGYERRDRDFGVSSIKVGDFTINWGPAALVHAQRELGRWVMP